MNQLSPEELADLEALEASLRLAPELPKRPPAPPRTLLKRPDPRKAARKRAKAARKRNR